MLVFKRFLPLFVTLLFLAGCEKSSTNTVTEEVDENSDEGNDDPVAEKDLILVFTKTDGFNHNTKDECVAMVEKIATNQNFDVVVDDTGDTFNDRSTLNQYKIIFFTNTSGNTLNATQRSNVENYAAQGGNFISNHAASDSYGHSTASSVSGNGKGVWDWYAENVTGCSVRNGPNHTSSGFDAVVNVENQKTEITQEVAFPWNDSEEWYYWEEGYLDDSFIEVLQVSATGSNSYDAPRMTAQYWERPDGGISFYTSMGHAKSKYSDTAFAQLMNNVFEYMLN
ncbi:ThuA domain-containing protein [Costertonia aggregata]|uniref:ThuA domain-containing protein n=1 Tax=Costertonia aggregata TaxID=343403 RepID=A0A7H9AP49_9FLAO|nr:ThuA domain-containing protein [Costertonia aggregata]QLG45174.1 ThuA domain-containing protein [Costertonia aggregata]